MLFVFVLMIIYVECLVVIWGVGGRGIFMFVM